MVRGGAQEIYFCEFDGPAHRTINVIIQEEKLKYIPLIFY